MGKHKALTDARGEVRELTTQDLARFKPADQALPRALQETLGMRRRGPQKAPTKDPVKLRLDADVLAALRATGNGWQTRTNNMLRASLQLAGQI